MQDQRKADRNQSSGTESSSSDPCCEHKDAVCWSLHRSHQQTRPRSHPTRPTFLEGEEGQEKARPSCPGRVGWRNKKLKAGMVKNELRSMYNFHRRNESSKPWRNRYTPKWKSLYKDWALRPGSRRGTIYSNATSQLDRRRATVSGSSARKAPSGNLEANYLSSNFYTNFETNISPTRAGAPMHADALDAQMNYTREHHNSGGGRTEETRDRVNQQQIDRSRISNRTRARGTEIAAGTTSADGWATIPAKRQVARMKMRVGQNDGPLC